MSLSFLPAYITEAVTDLEPTWLLNQGIRLLMLDFDNTLVPYTTDEPTEEVVSWLERMQASSVIICVVSNSHKERVRKFCERYEIPCITHAKKPFSRGIQQCLAQFGLPASSTALVGDQIYTDTLGANLNGVRPILVKAIRNHNIWLKLRHGLEMPFILMASGRKIGR